MNQLGHKETYRNPGFCSGPRSKPSVASFLLGVVPERKRGSPMTITRRAATIGGFSLLASASMSTLGRVDSKDSLLSANQIQSCFWGGSLGCDGSFGFERRGMGADGAPDYWPS